LECKKKRFISCQLERLFVRGKATETHTTCNSERHPISQTRANKVLLLICGMLLPQEKAQQGELREG